jgi:hypothetical protein
VIATVRRDMGCRRPIHVIASIAVAMSLLVACSSAGREVEGRWISSLMGDYFDCQGNLATLAIERDRIVVFLAGQPAQVFDDVNTRVLDDGRVEKQSGTARFVFANIKEDRMTLERGPVVQRTMLGNYPVELRRCP